MVLQLQGYIVHNEDNVASYKEWNRKEKEKGKKEQREKAGEEEREACQENIFHFRKKKKIFQL